MTERMSGETSRRAFLHRLLLGGAALAALPVLEACSTASPAPTAAPSKPAEAAKPDGKK